MPEVERVGDQADEDHGAPGEESARRRESSRGISAGDEQRRPQDGGEGGEPGERRLLIVEEARDQDQEESQRGRELLPARGVVEPAPRTDGQHRADEEFPRPGGEQVERRGGMPLRPVDAQAQARDRGQGDEPGHPPESHDAGEEQEEDRHEQIELLLDRERPGVEQGFLLGRRREVPGLAPELDVRDEEGEADDRLAERRVGGRDQQEPARQGGGRRDGQQGRQDPADPPHPEVGEREGPSIQVLEDEAGDQVARDHEEDVDADIAAREGEAGVAEEDAEHGDGPEPIDVRSIGHTTGIWCHSRLKSV